MRNRRVLRAVSAAIVVLAALIGLAAPVQAQRPMTLVDVLNVPRISDPQLSPDGRQILYVLSRADWKANKRISHIWRVQVDGANALQMTSGTEGETSPRWSPDGKTIAFVAKRAAKPDAAAGESRGQSRGDDANPSQIYLMPADGGEGRPLTKHPTSVSHIAWSSDGSVIYFGAPDEKTAEEKARDKAKDDVYGFDEDYRQPHIWKVEAGAGRAEAGREERITSGDYAITSFALSRDGRQFIVQRAPNPLLGSSDEDEVWIMNVDGSGARQLTHNKVPESGAEIAPDGSQVMFLAQANERFDPYYNRKIFLEPSSGGPTRVLTADLPYEVERATWSKDGKAIFFLANMGVHGELFQLDLAGGKPRQLTDGQHNVTNWTYSETLDRHVFTIDELSNPGDLYTLASTGSGAPTRVTHVFDHLARDFKLPRQEKLEWKGADGTTVEGILFYPIDYRPGQKYALAVQTHGGPQASDKFGFGSWGDYVQVLTAKGYAVLHPNYRGSTGTGDAFTRDMVGHYFRNAHLDVLAGVDKVIAMGLVDPDRLVKMGWSGGGHMTDKIITFTDRFKAASAGAGAANWISMYAQSDVRTYRTPWFGGTPWEKNAPIDVYWDNSPLKYVANVKTPTIFLVGEKDVRVPMPQSVEMYRALKSHGVPTHLYVAPREPHGWQELRHELFKMNVELGWFEKYAMKREYTWEKAPQEKEAEGVRTSTQDQ
jgi:dipeptidyl aminopeptidase/acylaminoacyl peptidase